MNNSSNSRMLIKTFSSLLCPPPPPPSSTLTADHFATFFINAIKTISAQLSTPQSVKHILQANIHSLTSFSWFSEAEVAKLIPSNHPTAWIRLIPFHLISFKPFLLQLFLHSLTLLTHPFTLFFFPSAFRQAHITPLLKKPTLNRTLLENYWPVSLFSFIADTLERAVFNQVSAFLSQSNLLDSNHSLVSEVDIQPRLGVMNQLTFSDHISKTARSCRLALFNIKKIRPFLSEHASQLLVQALVLSRLDYCNALLAGLPASSIKPLQLIQNAAARLIFNEPKRAHHTSVYEFALATNSCSH